MCSEEECRRKVYCKGKCRSHYEKAKREQKAAGGWGDSRRLRGPTCQIEDCEEPHQGRGYCQFHYDRWRATGDPLSPSRKEPAKIEDRGDHLAVLLGGENGKGLAALIDRGDRELIEGRGWWASAEREPQDRYAEGKADGEPVRMHRLLLGLSLNDPLQGDHINGDRLDNRRANLRIVTFAQQMQNKKPWGKSGHRNCHWEEGKQLWRVIVTCKGKRHSGGRHKDINDAIEAARLLREKLFSHANEDRIALEEEQLPGLDLS